MSAPQAILLLEERESCALAVALRERGYEVLHARSADDAVSRGRRTALAALVVPHAEGSEESKLVDALTLELGVLPPIFHLDESVREGDERAIASLIARIEDLTSSTGVPAELQVSEMQRIDLALTEGSVLRVVRKLIEEKRTGALFVRANETLGEVHLVNGDVEDVAYGRHEGEKAFCRMLDVSTGELFFEAREVDVVPLNRMLGVELVPQLESWEARARELRGALIARREATWNVLDLSALSDPTPTTRAVVAALRSPLTLAAILDSVAELDPDVLEAIIALENCGAIGVTSPLLNRVSLASVTDLGELRARLAGARAPGFEGPLRLVLAGAPLRLGVVGQALAAIEEAMDAGEASKRGALPGQLASLRLGEAQEIAVVGLPLVPAYAPLWPLVLAGALAVVRLDEASLELLRELCEANSISVHDARHCVDGYDDADPRKVAELVVRAIEASTVATTT